MTNDALEELTDKTSLLVRHQSAILKRVLRSNRFLLDIGSGSGRFLHHNRALFSKVVGIEISDRSIEYAKTQLGLEVLKTLDANLGTPSVVTFWQSLEHMPAIVMRQVLQQLGQVSDCDTRVIIAVPNNQSFQYATLRERYSFYDVPNHLHQFSTRSLDLLMEQHGFARIERFFSLPYVWFGWAQGLSNLMMPIRNYWYYRRKRGWDFGLSKRRLAFLDVRAGLVLCATAPIGLLCCLSDLVAPDRRGTITACYAKTA